MSLTDFLTWAATSPGVNGIVGFFESFAIEWIPGFDALEAKWKRLTTMLISFAIPVLATVSLWALGARPISIDSVWVALTAGFSAFFGSQLAHIRQLVKRQGSSITRRSRL